MMSVRRARAYDGPVLWTLNNLPNVGSTADPTIPLALPPAEEPPVGWPDLANVVESFVGVGGDFVVAELDGHLVGMAGYKPNGDGTATVLRVRVHPACRRKGIGAALMGEVERSATHAGFRKLVLDTADNQPEAVAFYKALGYTETGRETHPDWTWTLVYFAKLL